MDQDPDGVMKMLEDAGQLVFGTGATLQAKHRPLVSDMLAVSGAPHKNSVDALGLRLKGSGHMQSNGIFVARCALAHLLYRDLIAVLACVVGVYWNPRFDTELAHIVAVDQTDGYYSRRGI